MPSVTIGSRYSFIQIVRICHESYDLSQSLAISTVQDEFRGGVNVWVDEGAFRRFIQELRECEKTRRGEANLHSMSPEEFSLRIFNTHTKGDFALTYSISQCNGNIPVQLQGGFNLDPSLLLQILSDFETLYTKENRYDQRRESL